MPRITIKAAAKRPIPGTAITFCERTYYLMIHDGRLPACRVGRFILVDTDDLDNLLQPVRGDAA